MIAVAPAKWRFERVNDHIINVIDPCATTAVELNLHSTDRRVRSYYNLASDLLDASAEAGVQAPGQEAAHDCP